MKKAFVFLLVCFICSGLGAQNRGIEAVVDIFGNKGPDTRSGYSFCVNAEVCWRYSEFAFLCIGTGYHLCDALDDQFTEIKTDMNENYYLTWVNQFQLFCKSANEPVERDGSTIGVARHWNYYFQR